ncbi:MAG: hypothetical protein JXO51_00175 [Candidatus Aminicenantes bacterium]|nr:hypothetical protein [Candidatus Aminicenantes bacterium]
MTEKEKPSAGSLATPESAGSDFLEAYCKPHWQNSKFWLAVVALLFLAVFAVVYKKTVLNTAMSAAELKAAVELFDISSHWKVNEKVNEEDFQGVILVPEVSFRVRNASSSDLSYVFLLGVFRFMDSGKVIGEGYRMALRRPLPPRGVSERITLNAGFGYRASSAAAFEKYKHDWRNAMCEVFAKSHNSGMTPLQTFYISRRIEGLDVEVLIE